MSLITTDNLGKSYGANVIFAGVSVQIGPAERVGLVGPNGEGKTTLLRVIAGQIAPTTGEVRTRKGLRVGYLPQDPPEMGSATLRETMEEVFSDLRAVEERMYDLAHRMAERPDDETLRKQYAACQHDFEARGGYEIDSRIRTVLQGLGFSAEEHDQPLEQLSGGQQSRTMLARLLLGEPDVLLLDEPTNHLDLDAVEWLERYLLSLDKSLVIVSHDRYFLDRVTNATWEIAFARVEIYRGNYSQYVVKRRQRHEERMRLWESQQEYIARTEDFIRRNLAGQRTKEAQGRRSRLERFIAEEAIDRPRDFDTIHLDLQADARTGEIVLRARDLQAGYEEENPIVQARRLEVTRGQRIAIVGGNGTGKTTLLRTLLGHLAPLAGEVNLGSNVETGYLPQTHDSLPPQATVLDAVLSEAPPTLTPERARTLLGSMGFTGDDVFKTVSQLSGGQRSRVILAQLAIQRANVLMLDEPTNHLDLPSREILQDALNEFEGTVAMVSHDRYLVDAVATDIWAVADGTVYPVRGGWEDYLQWRSLHQAGQAKTSTAESVEKARRRDAHQASRERRKAHQRLQRRQGRLEEQIVELEAKLSKLNDAISAAGENGDVEEITRLGEEYSSHNDQLHDLYWQWEELAEQVEEMEASGQ